MEKIKLGIIGCGGIANNKHIPSMLKQPEVEIVAVCDIIKEKAESTNDTLLKSKARIYTDYLELLSDSTIDAVCVCTPNISHCQISVDAMESGKHVLCEKPMAINYAEAMKMVDAQKRTGKLLSIGYQNRYRPDSIYIKKECENGELGEIYFAKAKAIRRRAVPTWGVFLDEEKQGGGPLIDIGTHSLDLTLYMMNNYEPKYVVGTAYHKLNNQINTGNTWGDWNPEKFTVEDSAFGFIVMKNGATIILESSWALNTLDVGEAMTSLSGTKGGADMPREGHCRINTIKNGKQIITEPELGTGGVDFYDGTNEKAPDVEAKTFIQAVLGKGKLIVLPQQAATVTKILEGIYISAKSGKPYYFD
jgi:predicted dehydrogenase